MKKVKVKKYGLKTFKYALVDDEDFERVASYTWIEHYHGYAMTNKGGILMHRIVMLAEGRLQKVDHINGERLDNRKINLRICSDRQNQANRTNPNKNNTSGFPGVSSYNYNPSKWKAQIQYNGKNKSLGIFNSKEEAFSAYKEAHVKFHGEFSVYNT